MFALFSKEKCFIVTLLLITFSSWGEAENIIYSKDDHLNNSHAIKPPAKNYNVQYGLVTIHYGHNLKDKLAINNSTLSTNAADSFLAGTVEASLPPEHEVIRACLFANTRIKESLRLSELKPYISQSAYQTLESKVKSGAAEINVLQVLKNFVPDNISINDIQFQNETAKIIAQGRMSHTSFSGIIEMVREDSSWKLNNEVWFGEDMSDNKSKLLVKSTNYKNISEIYNADDIAQWYDPYGQRRKNPLGLRRAEMTMPKESFFLFFFVDHNSKNIKTSQQASQSAEDLPQLHVAWSGNFKTLQQQKLTGRYPLDMTIAQEKDGYKPGTMNLRLPKAKPKQFYVGMLFSF